MANKTDLQLIGEIAKKYGVIINLEETPGVLAEILRVYGCRVTSEALPKGSGGVQSGTIAGITGISGGSVAAGEGDATLSEVMRGLLQVQRDVFAMNIELKALASAVLETRSVTRKARARLKPKAKVPRKMKPKGVRA
jgi:hypothetical protein